VTPARDVDDLSVLLERLETVERRRTQEGELPPGDAAAARELEREVARRLPDPRPDGERRRRVRVPCVLEARLRFGGSAVGGVCRQIGFGGAFVETKVILEPGEQVALEVTRRPGPLEYGLKLPARVVWRGAQGVGIAFQPAEPSQERRLRRFVLDLLHAMARLQ
jgi:hypothetical protein